METTSGAAAQAGKSLKPNQAVIVGRINHVNTFESGGKRIHEARVAIAAADEFSMPGAVIVQSTYRLGDVGSDVRAQVEVTGYPDKWTDKSGTINQTARIVLRVVE